MPNGRRRTAGAVNGKRLSPARQKAISKVNKIITKHKSNAQYFQEREKSTRLYDSQEAAEFRVLAEEASGKIKKGESLINKIKKGQKKPLTTKSTIKELTPRAKPWVERILKNRNFVSAQMNPEERRAFEKMAAGKKVTRIEMNSIINRVQEYRWIVLGQAEHKPRQGRR